MAAEMSNKIAGLQDELASLNRTLSMFGIIQENNEKDYETSLNQATHDMEHFRTLFEETKSSVNNMQK